MSGYELLDQWQNQNTGWLAKLDLLDHLVDAYTERYEDG